MTLNFALESFGLDLSSHPVARKLLSALVCFTALFGMERSGSIPLKRPKGSKRKIEGVPRTVRYGICPAPNGAGVPPRLPFEALLFRAKEGTNHQFANFTTSYGNYQEEDTVCTFSRL